MVAPLISGSRLGARHFHGSSLARATHYDILQLSKTATRQQIKAQFYRLSKEYHPDVKSGNETKFQAISEAYATLGNADSRRAYDSSLGSYAPSHGRSGHHSHSSSQPHAGYYQQDTTDRRQRANYAWENSRRTNQARYAYQRHNPFASAQQQQAGGSAEDDLYERMQAREAWRASNQTSGARKRAMFESERIIQEENLRNTSGIGRALQFTGLFLGVLWLSGSLRAASWEKEGKELEAPACTSHGQVTEEASMGVKGRLGRALS